MADIAVLDDVVPALHAEREEAAPLEGRPWLVMRFSLHYNPFVYEFAGRTSPFHF